MAGNKAQRGHSMQANGTTCSLPSAFNVVIILCLYLVLAAGCNSFAEPEPPSLSGTFRGTTADGRAVQVTLAQKKNSLTGMGRFADKSFSFSGLPSWQGPLVVNFEEGQSARGSFTLSPDGKTLAILGMGPTFTLSRGGEPESVMAGPFAGHFGVDSPRPLWVKLTQADNLLAGTGFDDGKPVAFVGKVMEPRKARGTLLFPDKSQVRVTLRLSENQEVLTVSGLGGSLNLMKQ
jgi:hypothetical protein